jgi:4-amino-4-deoxy-L-arabinose transferase-like glycosyltransferase
VASDGEQQQQQQAETFAESMFGKDLYTEDWVKRWLSLPLTVRVVALTGGLAAFLFLPYLGAVGLWDPWETHYGEVARMMVARRDYVYPFWENAWFFSKPPLTMWLQALGMKVVGAMDGAGELGRYTEWGMRTPFALLSITAVVLLSLAVSRVVSRRAGLATGFVLATMPLYFLLTRQTVTDTPFVTTLVCAMACALIGQFDETTKHRAAWWYAFYIFLGLSVLAKGLLGGLPAAILLLYALLAVLPWSWDAARDHLDWVLKRDFRKAVREGRKPMPVLWAQFFRMRLLTGIFVFAAVAVPWYLTLSLFKGVDDEGKGFFYRFFIHDHLNRLTAGVHTTTPGGTFIYFIEQGGYAIFPWVALLPGAFAVVSRLRPRSASKADHLALIAVLWVAFSFWLLASSATKFHHYVFPVLPGLAILIALFIDRLWQDGPGEHAVSLIFGLVLFVLVGKDLAENPKNFTDLFVYNYDRPYPSDLVNKPIAMWRSRPLWMGDLVTMVLLSMGVYLCAEAFFPKEKAPGTSAKEKEGAAREEASQEAAAKEAPQEVAAKEEAPKEEAPQEVAASDAESAAKEVSPPVEAPKEVAAAKAEESTAKEGTTQEGAAKGSAAKAREGFLTTPRVAAILILLAGIGSVAVVGTRGEVSAMGLLGVALLLMGVFTAVQAVRATRDALLGDLLLAGAWLLAGAALAWQGFRSPLGTDPMLRVMMEPVNVKKSLGFAFSVAGALCVVAALKQAKGMLFACFWVFALSFAVWFNWNHWVDLSHHWTQRDLFWRYWRQRQPGEPIAAFMMNWRGETFYSRNQVEQFRAGDANVRMRNYAAQPGREWALVEHSRLGLLTSAVGPDKKVNVIDRDINNKFVLVTID